MRRVAEMQPVHIQQIVWLELKGLVRTWKIS